MFGPLPFLHRILLVVAALVVCAGLGIWLGLVREVPIGVSVGVVVGIVTGLAAAFLLVHDFRHRGVQAARARRRPH